MAIHLKNRDIRTAALRLLSLREHSQQELTDKLRVRGFSMDQIEPLCQELLDKGYLDDRRVIDLHLAQALHKRDKGARRLRQELGRRGLSHELIDLALDSYSAQVDEGLAAKGIAERLLAKGKDRKTIERHLWRQGFSSSQVRAALNLDNELVDS